MITSFIVTNVRLYRDALADSLAGREGLRILGCGGFNAETSERLCELGPDTVVFGFPGPDSVSWIKSLAASLPKSRFVIVGCDDNQQDIMTCVFLGVSGIVSLDGSLEELILTLKFAARDEFRCSPKAAAALVRCVGSDIRQIPGMLSSSNKLTKREREIAGLIEKGYSNKQIARVLSIQLSTVKNHVHKILEKLNVSSRGEAAAYLRRQTRTGTSGVDVPAPP